MDALRRRALATLNDSRTVLLSIPKDQLTGGSIHQWFAQRKDALAQADMVAQSSLVGTIAYQIMDSLWNEKGHDVCLDLRDTIVWHFEHPIQRLSQSQTVKPVLDDYISKVANAKLATLLKEFTAARNNQPNLACIGFRTILPLIIRERAKLVDPAHRLAIKDDLGFEPDIRSALQHGSLFNVSIQVRKDRMGVLDPICGPLC